MNKKEAFKTMFLFLDHYYERTLSDDIGSLLGDMSFLQNERTADPAAWEGWTKIIDKIIPQHLNNELMPREAFEAMRLFLEQYHAETSSNDVASILTDMYISSAEKIANPVIWEEWLQRIGDVKAGKGDFYLRLS